MASYKDVVVAFILGVCLLQYGSASISINMVAYNGQVGHATSYNYPFRHSHDTDTYIYRLFADSVLAQKLCLTVRRFAMTDSSRFIINVPILNGSVRDYEYDGYGESVNHPANSTLPDNLWTQPFCVDLEGDTLIMLTFHPETGTQQSGFYIEYHTTSVPETNESLTAVAPCGPGLFSCYNRECVNVSDVCTDNAACTDLSHNTYAHAFCINSDNTPSQQGGFWAHNLDMSIDGAITADAGWVFAEYTYPFIGPPSDHTGGGMFLQTRFRSTQNSNLKLTFNPGKLIQKENCLSFWYYMDGPDPGKLVAEWGITKVWQRAGRYGAKWLQAQANLFCEESELGCDKTVTITASKGSNPDTRISVDDISVMPGLCPFYEADVIKDAWTTDDDCTVTDERLICSLKFSYTGHTESWLVSRGKCLVGQVLFDFSSGQKVEVYKQPALGGSKVSLKTILRGAPDQTVRFKIPINLSVPARIGFTTTFNYGQIILEKIHVVDNECDNLSFEDEEITTFSPLTSPEAPIPPAGNYPNASNNLSDIGITITIVFFVSIITIGVYISKNHCKKPAPPQRHSQHQSHTGPHIAGAPPDAIILEHLSSPDQPPPYTGQVTDPPPYSQQPPPAYDEVCGGSSSTD